MDLPPVPRRGASYAVSISCVSWIDLLGYGSMLRKVGFDPTADLARDAVERIEAFHAIVADHSKREFRTVVMNDGAVALRDLSPRSHSVTYDFLARSIDLFNSVNEKDSEIGARMVIAAGFRMETTARDHIFRTSLAQRVLEQLRIGSLDAEEAVHQALVARPDFQGVPALQANFAFTKAYLVESKGTDGGFGGANCFIDLALFDQDLPEWIKFSELQCFHSDGISGRFGKLRSFDRESAGKARLSGVLDALGIAEKIGGAGAAQRMLDTRRRA
ncbi:hypothetical protein V3331_02550 [Gaopeijia maritima]|uniref:hypothetical protein n=1 Tax=Gaopeijia maritima TaxID=3119007 RepID=UPI003249257A